jgi:hypothetical protein
MRRTISIIAAALGCALLGLDAGHDAAAQTSAGVSKSALAARAQATRPARPRTRIRVTPYPYRTYPTVYPVPYPAEYPGPGFVRQCVSWLAPENRASGPVIVPRMRCRWTPGVSDLKSYP